MNHRMNTAAGMMLGTLGAMVTAGAAHAQEAMYTAAATMPSKGTVLLREQFFYAAYGDDPTHGVSHTNLFVLDTNVSIGIERGLALYIDVPLETRQQHLQNGPRDTDTLVPSTDLMLKWRVYQDDSGGVDTLRIAVLGGVRFGSDGEFSANPHLGAVLTKVWGRHGFNQELHYTFNTGTDSANNYGGTGTADAFAFNSAYLFRIEPEAYTSESTGAWYFTAEMNGLYETNGDVELRFSPGLMYEGRDFGFEVMGQVPIYADVHHRAPLQWSIGVGVRFLF